MRKFPLGQDRYARQYWMLPDLGGIVVEGVETSLDSNNHSNERRKTEITVSEDGLNGCGEGAQLSIVGTSSKMEMGSCDHSVKEECDSSSQPPGQLTPSEHSHNKVIHRCSTIALGHENGANPGGLEQQIASTKHSGVSCDTKDPLRQLESCDTKDRLRQLESCDVPTQSSKQEPTADVTNGDGSEVTAASQSPVAALSTAAHEITAPTDNRSDERTDEEHAMVTDTPTSQNCTSPDTHTSTEPQTVATPTTAPSPSTAPPATTAASPWFSLLPRTPCEVWGGGSVVSTQPAQNQQVIAPQQQYIMASPMTQYAYITPSGAVISQPVVQQVGGGAVVQQVGGGAVVQQVGGGAVVQQVGYTLIGNTLVPQAQYVSVNPTQQVQYVVSNQQGVQYVTMGAQQQAQGVQYVSLGGNQVMVVQTGGGAQAIVAAQEQPVQVGAVNVAVDGGEGVNVVAVDGGEGVNVAVDGGEGVNVAVDGGEGGNVAVDSNEGVKSTSGEVGMDTVAIQPVKQEESSASGSVSTKVNLQESEVKGDTVLEEKDGTNTGECLYISLSSDSYLILPYTPKCTPTVAPKLSESQEIQTVLNHHVHQVSEVGLPVQHLSEYTQKCS